MYFVFVLQSEATGRHYVGHTSDLTQRLSQHNNGITKSTKNRGPWKLVGGWPGLCRWTWGALSLTPFQGRGFWFDFSMSNLAHAVFDEGSTVKNPTCHVA